MDPDEQLLLLRSEHLKNELSDSPRTFFNEEIFQKVSLRSYGLCVSDPLSESTHAKIRFLIKL
jgi:hypothetical protein